MKQTHAPKSDKITLNLPPSYDLLRTIRKQNAPASFYFKSHKAYSRRPKYGHNHE